MQFRFYSKLNHVIISREEVDGVNGAHTEHRTVTLESHLRLQMVGFRQ